MITNFSKNCMGTISFDAKFNGMRKAQDFIVYPMQHDYQAKAAKIQSDTRIGTIDLSTGLVMLSPARAGGSYEPHMAFAAFAGMISSVELLLLKSNIFATAHGKAGDNGIVYCNNLAALEVFGV